MYIEADEGKAFGRAARKGPSGQWGGEVPLRKQRGQGLDSLGPLAQLVVDNPTKMPPGKVLGGICF